MRHFLPRYAEEGFLQLLEDLSTPRSLTVKLLFEHGEWEQLCELRTLPEHYTSSYAFWADNMATEFLRKCADLPTDRGARSRRTLASFFSSEAQCFRSNRRFDALLGNADYVGLPEGVHEYFSRVRKYIRYVLGDKPPSILEGRFGPGATFGDKGRNSTIPDKMSSNPTFTPSAWTFLSTWKDTLWCRSTRSDGREPVCVRGNRFHAVPKDAMKDRGIAVEPSINVFYQLGLGRAIRSRLRRRGIDLDSAQDLHRALARCASTEGHLATIDLSNASDTISTNLVKFLLPPAWFDQLDALRSPFTFVDGKWLRLEKFSSMGNGYTFELETLIFLALCAGVCGFERIGTEVLAFGDDLIIPSQFIRGVTAVLSFCGLEVNSRKSFSSGPFRESCGGDYFDGEPVRAHYLKESPNEPHLIIGLANGLLRAAQGHPARSYAIRRARTRILSGLPLEIRILKGPSALGDLVVQSDDFATWKTKWRHGVRYFKVWRPVKWYRKPPTAFSPDVQLASAVYGALDSELGVTPRDGVLGYAIRWVPYS